MIIKKYKIFKESLDSKYLPTYEDCVELCNNSDKVFYEVKTKVKGYDVSLFNYRLAQSSDFDIPWKKEMRGLTFVFNKDGSLFNRFILLEKFFNLNQAPESMYSVVKNFKIKHINNKEDGSIASFIQLPDGEIIGKSKMGFNNDQANGINKIYKENKDVKSFVDWCFDNDISTIWEYVSAQNRIVLRYSEEELILLRLRDNKTGEHLEIKDYLDKIGSIKIAPFEDDHTLDELIKLSETETDKEGWVVQHEKGFYKLKTKWYFDRHGLLTNGIYKENIIIGYILDDKIDDILAQVPEDEVEARDRIQQITKIVKEQIKITLEKVNAEYKRASKISRRDYAINHKKGNPLFPFIMSLMKADELKKLTKEEILQIYDNIGVYEESLERLEPYNLVVDFIRKKTFRLEMARYWLRKIDPTLFFKDPEENENNN